MNSMGKRWMRWKPAALTGQRSVGLVRCLKRLACLMRLVSWVLRLSGLSGESSKSGIGGHSAGFADFDCATEFGDGECSPAVAARHLLL